MEVKGWVERCVEVVFDMLYEEKDTSQGYRWYEIVTRPQLHNI
jgi:hypothetical protein